MHRTIPKAITHLILILSLLGFAGCGGGGGGPGADDTPATVGVLITDAPAGQWDEAIATITSVSLIGDGGHVTLFTGSATLDLLQLGDFSELLAVSELVPPGQYSKIRLQLSDLVLNDVDPATGAVVESVHAQLVGNGKIDLNPRGLFRIGAGETLFVELDFDMEKSLKMTETGNGRIIVRPVVFVSIHGGVALGRLSRIHGEIAAVDAAAGTLRLCQTEFASRWDKHDGGHNGEGDDEGDDDQGGHDDDGQDRDRCLTVRTDAETGIFGTDGLPQDFAGLAVGEQATAIGRLQGLDTEALDDRLRFAMDAAVIEAGPLGTFRRIAGTAASGVDDVTGQFGLDVAPGQGIATDAALPVQLFEHSRIFDPSGTELGRADIVAGRRALADGVLQIGAEDLLRSPLVILDTRPPLDEIAVKGNIVSVDTAAQSLLVTTATGDRCVDATEADVFLISHGDGLSATHGTLADLQPGQLVVVFGTEGAGGCITAGTILAEA